MRSFDLNSTPLAAPGLELRQVGDEQLVLEPVSARVHVLNQTAGIVLANCDGATKLGHIAAELARAANVAPGLVERDVIAVCAAFEEQRLLD